MQRVRARHVIDIFAAPAQEAKVLQALDRAADGAVLMWMPCAVTFYSIFTPAALTTSPHFTRCSRVKAMKASGLSDSTESAPALLS